MAVLKQRGLTDLEKDLCFERKGDNSVHQSCLHRVVVRYRSRGVEDTLDHHRHQRMMLKHNQTFTNDSTNILFLEGLKTDKNVIALRKQ